MPCVNGKWSLSSWQLAQHSTYPGTPQNMNTSCPFPSCPKTKTRGEEVWRGLSKHRYLSAATRSGLPAALCCRNRWHGSGWSHERTANRNGSRAPSPHSNSFQRLIKMPLGRPWFCKREILIILTDLISIIYSDTSANEDNSFRNHIR
jgi:hypothetical protein